MTLPTRLLQSRPVRLAHRVFFVAVQLRRAVGFAWAWCRS